MFDFKIPEGSLDSRIRKNVMSRQKLKKKWDKHCKYDTDTTDNRFNGATFSVEKYSADNTDNWVRLLDEGVVVEGDGTPFCVIAKGTIKKWFENLPANFRGYINKDHISGIGLGYYSKADLRLVKLDNDRYGVDVNVKLDHELYAVKDLLRQMNRKALSSEFFYEADEYVKASVVTGEKEYPDWYLIPKITEVDIVGYAVVDNPKNANSYDPDLLEKASDGSEERNSMNEDELKKFVAGEGEDAPATETETDAPAETETDGAENTEVEAPAETPEVEANAEGADEATDAEDATEGEATDDTENADEKSEEGEEVEEAEDAENYSAEDLLGAVEALKAENAKLQAENAELKTKLSAQKTAKADLADRLGEALGLATAAESTEDEGSTPDKKELSNAEAYAEALKKDFSEL